MTLNRSLALSVSLVESARSVDGEEMVAMAQARGNTLIRPAVVVGALAAAAVTAAACAGSGTSSAPPSQAGAARGTTASTVTVETRSGPLGTYLTDEHGRSLYMFASDTRAKSSCTGECLTYWPPVTDKATASGAAKASLLGTATDADGAKQVTYAGHRLYTYAGDKSPGDTSGQGSNNFGAKWWLLTSSGRAITGSPGGAASSGSYSSPGSGSGGGSGGGGGGW